jgi:hypothetical protein
MELLKAYVPGSVKGKGYLSLEELPALDVLLRSYLPPREQGS